jgi:hypothetical protein
MSSKLNQLRNKAKEAKSLSSQLDERYDTMTPLSDCNTHVTESYDVIGDQTFLGSWNSTTIKEDVRN